MGHLAVRPIEQRDAKVTKMKSLIVIMCVMSAGVCLWWHDVPALVGWATAAAGWSVAILIAPEKKD
jgi:hypothetical protein